MLGLGALKPALRELRTSLELSPAADEFGIWELARGIVGIELALAVACLRNKDSDVLVAHEGADLDPLEGKSCRWAEGKEKDPEDSRIPRVLG